MTDSGDARPLRPDELRLLSALLDKATPGPRTTANLDELRVLTMADSGMGSVRFSGENGRRFGRQVAEVVFRDRDGVGVSATLNLDKEGRLFEIDVFKGDFSPLLEIPEDLE